MATMHTEIQLSPLMWDDADGLTRCIYFDLYWSCTPLWVETTQMDITFGGPWQLPGHFEGDVKIPKGQYGCVAAYDPWHTLMSCAMLECDGVVFNAIFKGDPFFGGNWLVGGNLDKWEDQPFSPRAIDISDYGIFVGQFLQPAPGDTPCGLLGPDDKDADINGDGVVDEMDFTFIAINFLVDDKDCICCPERDTDGSGRASIPVREFVEAGHPEMAAGDLNGDGVLDQDDVSAFMNGVRPKGSKRINSTGR
jgi:hypothetical protein